MTMGSGREDESRRGVNSTSQQKAQPANFGIFLGGGAIPPRKPEFARSKTEGRALIGNEGNTIGSENSLGPKNSQPGLVRDRSFPP